jgi:protease I
LCLLPAQEDARPVPPRRRISSADTEWTCSALNSLLDAGDPSDVERGVRRLLPGSAPEIRPRPHVDELPMSTRRAAGKDVRTVKVAFLMAPEGVEQIELTDPWAAVTEAGGIARLVSTRHGEVQAFHHLDRAERFPVDETVAEAMVSEYDGLVLPGGVANPDALRMDEQAVAFVKEFFDAGKPVAAICHGPWTLVEADVVRGRVLTSYRSLRTDIRNAGGTWVDERVTVCRERQSTLITSRKPDDLRAFDEAFLREFSKIAA